MCLENKTGAIPSKLSSRTALSKVELQCPGYSIYHNVALSGILECLALPPSAVHSLLSRTSREILFSRASRHALVQSLSCVCSGFQKMGRGISVVRRFAVQPFGSRKSWQGLRTAAISERDRLHESGARRREEVPMVTRGEKQNLLLPHLLLFWKEFL